MSGRDYSDFFTGGGGYKDTITEKEYRGLVERLLSRELETEDEVKEITGKIMKLIPIIMRAKIENKFPEQVQAQTQTQTSDELHNLETSTNKQNINTEDNTPANHNKIINHNKIKYDAALADLDLIFSNENKAYHDKETSCLTLLNVIGIQCASLFEKIIVYDIINNIPLKNQYGESIKYFSLKSDKYTSENNKEIKSNMDIFNIISSYVREYKIAYNYANTNTKIKLYKQVNSSALFLVFTDNSILLNSQEFKISIYYISLVPFYNFNDTLKTYLNNVFICECVDGPHCGDGVIFNPISFILHDIAHGYNISKQSSNHNTNDTYNYVLLKEVYNYLLNDINNLHTKNIMFYLWYMIHENNGNELIMNNNFISKYQNNNLLFKSHDVFMLDIFTDKCQIMKALPEKYHITEDDNKEKNIKHEKKEKIKQYLQSCLNEYIKFLNKFINDNQDIAKNYGLTIFDENQLKEYEPKSYSDTSTPSGGKPKRRTKKNKNKRKSTRKIRQTKSSKEMGRTSKRKVHK